MKKLVMLIGMLIVVILFSCEKEECRICTLHQTSIPIIPEWEKIVEFEACGNDLHFWNGKIDSLVIGDVIYITKTTCSERNITK